MQSCRPSSRETPRKTASVSIQPSSTKGNQSLIPTEGKYVPNFTTISNTWDVRHLDKFLNGSDYALNSPPVSVRVSRSPRILSAKHRQVTHTKGSASMGGGSGSPCKESHFMRCDGRDSAAQKKEYMLNIFRDFGTKGVKNDYNTLALMSGVNPEVAKDYHARRLTPYNKGFDPLKLDFGKQTESGLRSPQQRKLEIDQIKANQVEFQKWSERQKEMTKMNRICQNGYRSGILGLDSPTSPSTHFFTEAKSKLDAKLADEKHVESRRVNQLVSIVGTSPAVEFLNNRFNEEDIRPPVRIVDKNIKKTVDSPHVKTWQDSNARLFGEVHSNVSERRREFLARMDTGGKDYDIISIKVHKKE